MPGDRTLPPPRATLSDVAHLAGVSLKTASRALAGEKYVSDATRAAVQAAAKQLGYRRNAAASLLASGRPSDSVGLLVGELTNPFYAGIAEGLDRALPGTPLIVSHTGESPEREWLLAQRLAESRVQAIVVASSLRDHAQYRTLAERGIALVFVDRPPINLDADCVLLDNRGAGVQAGRHLIAHGHTRIGVIVDYLWLHTHRERLAGLVDAYHEAGLDVPPELIHADAHDAEQAQLRASALLDRPDPPTALVGGNNRIILGIISELRARALGADARPGVLGFDDFEWAPTLRLTVLAHDPRDLGRHAGELIRSRLKHHDRPCERVILPMEITPRGSAERPPQP